MIRGPFSFSNPEQVMMSAASKSVAISIWDSHGEEHQYIAVIRDGEMWFGTRGEYDAMREGDDG